MKDWLGQEISAGDTIIYAAMSGRSVTMILGTVVKFNDSGSVTVQPVKSSRWKQHRAPEWFVDTRTGKRISNVCADEHVAEGGYWRYSDGTTSNASYRFPESGVYVPLVFKDHVKKESGSVKPVTLTVTKNITKWTGEVPDAD